jgi:hypothetical protein
MNQIKYEIVGRFENGNKYGATSKKTVSGYQIDEHAAARKQDHYWVVDSFETGVRISLTGSKTRKAAIEYYMENLKEKTDYVLSDAARLENLIAQKENAKSETELAQYTECDYTTIYNYRLDKVEQAAKNAGCILRKETDATYQNGGHIKIYGSPDMLKDVYALIDRYAEHDKQVAAEQAAAKQAEQASETEKAEQEPEKEINVETLTEENIAAYLPALLMSLANDKHNSSAIMAAGVEAKVITPVQLLEYLQTGKMPAVHTFDVWKKAGFKVKKGEKAAFQARIWKHTEKVETDVETDAEEQAEEKKSHDFIRKTAYFFTAQQVEKAPEEKPLPDLPADVKQETKNGCVWISGNTKPIKEDLKAAGFSWSKKNSAWYKRAAA